MIQTEIEIKPLSVNKAWQGKRFKTQDYKSFEQEFLYTIGKHKMVKGEIEVVLEFYIKNDKATDIDNCVKTCLDCIVKAGMIEDDRKIRHLDIYKYHSTRERINIVINKYGR